MKTKNPVAELRKVDVHSSPVFDNQICLNVSILLNSLVGEGRGTGDAKRSFFFKCSVLKALCCDRGCK